jgi:hypothetical protein
LSDYASIKNGSYAKLMKAYYGTNSASVSSSVSSLVNSSSTTADQSKTISALKSGSSSLKDATDALTETGSKSLFTQKDITTKDENGVETTTKGYDTDAIYKQVSAFASAYNSVLSTAADSSNTKVLSAASGMVSQTATNENLLGKIGITIGSDNKLSVDEETFKAADMSTVKALMNGTGSYASSIGTKASLINMYAQQDAAKSSGLYTQSGTYSSLTTSGYNYSSWF